MTSPSAYTQAQKSVLWVQTAWESPPCSRLLPAWRTFLTERQSLPQVTPLACSSRSRRWMRPKRSRRTSSLPSVTCLPRSRASTRLALRWAILTPILTRLCQRWASSRPRSTQLTAGIWTASSLRQWMRSSALIQTLPSPISLVARNAV